VNKSVAIVRTIAVLFAAVAGYLFWWSYQNASLAWPWLGACFSVCAFGLWQRAAWAKNAATLLLTGLIVIWAFVSALYAFLHGVPYETTLEIVISLVPGALLVAVVACVIVVMRKALRQDQKGSN
jgi:hypothetical protein